MIGGEHMKTRRLGKTGLMVSEIGFGGEWLERDVYKRQPGGAVKKRRNRVCDGIHDKYPFRYILNDKIAIHVVL